MIEVVLLGPPRVERDGVLVAFDTRKAVALLAHLVLTDRSVPRAVLADLLWPDADPERARGALRRTLSSLRGALGAELLEATRDDVRLLASPGLAVDVHRFRELRARGDDEPAVALFRGDLLEGFAVRDAPAFEDWVQVEAEGLRRELTAALAALGSAREAAGDTAGAVRHVRRWLALDPLHEPAHRALIRLYAESGDRAAALVQYRECVRTLSRELGVPPLAETTELYEAINRGTYAPAVAPPRPSATPTATPTARAGRAVPFVGRAADLRTLLAGYDAVGPDGRVALVEGEAGIGKTRLVEELLADLRRAGARVLTGRAYEDEAGLAYAPLVDALRGRLRVDEDWLVAVGDRARSETARLLPEIAADRVSAPGEPIDGPGAEARFLAGVWDTLTAASAGSAPGVLFIDDAQWTDDASRSLLSYGLRRLAGRPLLLLLTWRTPQDHPLLQAATAVARAGGGTVLRLERLDVVAVRAMLRAIRTSDQDADQAPDQDRGAARRLWETTEGVPLMLVEHLRAHGGAAGDGPLPTPLRDLLRARLDPLSETSRQVLAAAAVLGRSFDVDTVRDVSGRSPEETVTALEEVVRRGLVRERDLDYDFAHELVRALVHDETSLARRRLLHGRAADVLGAPSAAVARHLHLAGRDRDAALAFRAAGEQARAVFANAEALDHLRTALALGHPDRTGLLVAVGDLQTVLGDYAGALLSLETAAAGCGPDELHVVEHRLGRLQHRRGEYAIAEAYLIAARRAAPATDIATHAGIAADTSLVAYSRGDRDLAHSLAREAEALAEDAGDPHALSQAYNLLGMLATVGGDPEAALAHLGRSRELADELGEADLRIAARNNLALAHRARGELDAAVQLTTAALDLCSALGDRHREAALHNNLADLLHASGHQDEAMAHLKAAVGAFAEIGASQEPSPEIWKLVRW